MKVLIQTWENTGKHKNSIHFNYTGSRDAVLPTEKQTNTTSAPLWATKQDWMLQSLVVVVVVLFLSRELKWDDLQLNLLHRQSLRLQSTSKRCPVGKHWVKTEFWTQTSLFFWFVLFTLSCILNLTHISSLNIIYLQATSTLWALRGQTCA